MGQLLEQGGWVLVAIVALSLVAWGLLASQWLRLRQSALRSTGWADRAVEQLGAGHRRAALEACLGHEDLVGRLLQAGLSRPDPRRFFQPGHLEPLLAAERVDLGRHLPLIAVLASLATLLGLLGTILGMVQTFGVITVHGTRDVGRFADGISQALVTTQAGLVTALPILVLHGWLRGRVRRCLDTARLHTKRIQSALEHG
ncbi:MAG: MotA/TolQ/ExbB proton channel family protein [Planctomycetota bacterium]